MKKNIYIYIIYILYIIYIHVYMEWVAIPFSRGTSQPRDQTQVFYTAGRFLTTEPADEPRCKLGSASCMDLHEVW